MKVSPYPGGGTRGSGAGVCPDHAGQDGRGAERTEAEAKNVGVEETDPRRPHFSVTGESSGVRAGNRPNHNGTNQNWKTR